MMGLGWPELLVILVLAALVLGGGRLAELGRGLGRGIGAVKKELDEAGVDTAEVAGHLGRSLPGVRQVNAVRGVLEQTRDISDKLDGTGKKS